MSRPPENSRCIAFVRYGPRHLFRCRRWAMRGNNVCHAHKTTPPEPADEGGDVRDRVLHDESGGKYGTTPENSELVTQADDVERVARAMDPTLFGTTDERAGPTTRSKRDKLREYARAAIATLRIKATREAQGTPAGEVGDLVERLRRMGPRPEDGGEARHNRMLYAEAADTLTKLQATVSRLEAMLVGDPNDVSAGVPEALIEIGMAVQDRANEDHRNYVSGQTTDWDEGMLAAAIFKAMLRAALTESTTKYGRGSTGVDGGEG